MGGLGFIGYLALVSDIMYAQWGATMANIPVMFAVLTMNPGMSHGQWLLVTLTAGVALMGQARGKYTFFSHLKEHRQSPSAMRPASAPTCG